MANPSEPVNNQYASLVKLASLASVVVAVILIAIKLFAWFFTGSVSLLASLLDSTMDSAASLFNLIAIRYSLQPADKEHRFGHGKAESIAGLFQSAFIAGSAAFLWLHAIGRLQEPQPLQQTDIGVIVMAASLLLTVSLVFFQRYVTRQTRSTAIEADSLHYLSDILSNLAVLLVLLLNDYLWPQADALLGIALSLYIFYSAGTIAYRAIQSLLDRELPDSDRERIIEIVTNTPQVLGLHELRTREAGHMRFIQLHIDLDKTIDLQTAHNIADEVQTALLAEFPDADILIHPDPV